MVRTAAATPPGDRNDEPIELTLTTRTPAGVVRIDGGDTYDMVHWDALSLNQRFDLGNAIKRCRIIEGKKKRTAADDREYVSRVLWMCQQITPTMPAAVMSKLPIDQREALVATFFARNAGRNAAVLRALGLPVPALTPSGSSPNSRRRTAATRRAG